jgi:hypothetical protein
MSRLKRTTGGSDQPVEAIRIDVLSLIRVIRTTDIVFGTGDSSKQSRTDCGAYRNFNCFPVFQPPMNRVSYTRDDAILERHILQAFDIKRKFFEFTIRKTT